MAVTGQLLEEQLAREFTAEYRVYIPPEVTDNNLNIPHHRARNLHDRRHSD
jgi:hypothetical protein